jgi:hypothetical protein
MCSPLQFQCEGLTLDGSTDPIVAMAAGSYPNIAEGDTPIEIPYNNNVRYLPLCMVETNYLDGYLRQYVSSGSADGRVLWAAGDDFTLGLRRSPVIVSMPLS